MYGLGFIDGDKVLKDTAAPFHFETRLEFINFCKKTMVNQPRNWKVVEEPHAFHYTAFLRGRLFDVERIQAFHTEQSIKRQTEEVEQDHENEQVEKSKAATARTLRSLNTSLNKGTLRIDRRDYLMSRGSLHRGSILL